ncbi:UDP-perosamine 4-acetyltransferase [Clostridium pascui]|uniref:acetyltransferase n=1 Tax=Clostridium pascui TaxID=46609 RepID=UPI0019570972|nr:acetyltransferase [Clostridium pascui]MBM7869450.1 UDP-perosamine 4-acetyltransferase [Clostridium pascui]
MKKIILVGAGGHCKVIIDIIKSQNEFEIVGITDKNPELNNILDIPIIGDDSKLKQIYDDGVDNAFICVGSLNNNNLRSIIYKSLKNIGFKLPVLVHKNSIISEFVYIEEGTCIMPGAIINSGTCIGKNCIINTGSLIEHDCKVGDNTHISPNVSIAGGVNIGFNTHIGIGSSIIQGVNLGNNVTIGAGAVVINDINSNSLAVGVPAKIIRINHSV